MSVLVQIYYVETTVIYNIYNYNTMKTVPIVVLTVFGISDVDTVHIELNLFNFVNILLLHKSTTNILFSSSYTFFN